MGAARQRGGEKEECKHAHIKSGHLLKIRVTTGILPMNIFPLLSTLHWCNVLIAFSNHHNVMCLAYRGVADALSNNILSPRTLAIAAGKYFQP
jgi:hypothetical protein